jgi:sugar phosphate permease
MPRARHVVTSALLAQLSISVTEQGLPGLNGFVKQALGLSAFGSGLLVSAVLIGEVVGSYGAGSLADILGARTVMGIGSILGGVLVMLASVLPRYGLVASLVAAGVFFSAVTPAGARLIRDSVSRAKLGTGLGIRQAGVPMGGFVAALSLPAIAATVGWREAVATAGALTAAGGVGSLMIARVPARRARATPQPPPRKRPRMPGWPLRLAALWACFLVSGQYVILAFLALYVHQKTQFSLATSSAFVATAQVGGIVGRISWGWVSDRFANGKPKELLILLSTLGSLVAVAFAFLPDGASTILLGGLALAGGVTLLGWQGVWIAFISDLDVGERAGRSIGFALTFVNLAGFAAAPLFGLVLDASHSFALVWTVAGAATALSIIPLVVIRQPKTGQAIVG